MGNSRVLVIQQHAYTVAQQTSIKQFKTDYAASSSNYQKLIAQNLLKAQ